jgi:hypothetical protein
MFCGVVRNTAPTLPFSRFLLHVHAMGTKNIPRNLCIQISAKFQQKYMYTSIAFEKFSYLSRYHVHK